jgi:hypothetical protein
MHEKPGLSMRFSYPEPRCICINARTLANIQMKINLRGGDVIVAEIILNDLQRDALVELPSGAGVAEGMAASAPGYVSLRIDVLDMALKGALGPYEDIIVIEFTDGLGIAMREGEGMQVDRGEAVLSSLPKVDIDPVLILAEVPYLKITCLIDPQSGEEHRTTGDKVLDVIDGENEAIYLIIGENLR